MIGVGLSIVQLAVRQLLGRTFNPLDLFANNEQGAWYDPSDLTTLFTDSAGTTPVTAVEQPVGLMLDKSKGLVLGPQLVTNGDFSNGTTGWTLNSGATITGGQLVFTSVASTLGARQTSAYVNGATYRVTATIVSIAAGQVRIRINGGTFWLLPTTPGTYSQLVVAGATGPSITELEILAAGTTTTTIDNISVRELPGNHALQATAASRPVLSARVNAYLNTETLATQNVTTVATSYRLRFEGAGTITLSGTATGTYSAGTHTITCTAGTLTSTVSGTVTKADLRVSNDGVGLPAYQRVNTATDYDTTGFPLYLRADGVDDGMVTNSIDFTATDKITVWAGVRKLSATVNGVLVELGTGYPRSFSLFAPNALATYRMSSSGDSANADALTPAIYAEPCTNVVTGQGNISAPLVNIRVDGVLKTTTTTSQGAGNYANAVLYLFRRTGSSLPFNGRFYGLILRGAASTTAQIADAEKWVAGKTGFTAPVITSAPTIGVLL